MDEDTSDLEYKIKEVVSGVISGTAYAPPEGAILTECVVIMGWFYADGSYGSSHIICGPPWAGHGLTTRCLQRIEIQLANEIDENDDD